MKRIIKYEIFEDLTDDQLEYLKDVIKKFPHKEGDVHIKKLSKMMDKMDDEFLEMKRFLDSVVDGKWNLDESGRINVDGNFGYGNSDYVKYGLNFGKVSGNFKIGFIGLTNTEGLPYEVGGDFEIKGNKIGSLIGCPKKVGGIYDATNCGLKSLEGAPEEVNDFDVSYNDLESLKWGPKTVTKNMKVIFNKLKNLKYSPVSVGGEFEAYNNEIESLEGAPMKIGTILGVKGNKIKSLSGITPEIGSGADKGTYRVHNNEIKDLIGLPESFGGSIWITENPLESLEGLTDNVGYISWTENGKEFHSVGKRMDSAKKSGSYLAYTVEKNSDEVNRAIEEDPDLIENLYPLFDTDWYKPNEFVTKLYNAHKRGF
jgi:hypothetical protein